MIARALLIATALAACSGPHKVTVEPGQVIQLGTMELRTREGDVIDVSATRGPAAHEQTGTARLAGMTVDEAKASPLLRIAAARAWLAVVEAIAAEDPEAAYRAGLSGIEELGTGDRAPARAG